jgi:hypothetical protein
MVKRSLLFFTPLVCGAAVLSAAWYLRRHVRISPAGATMFVPLGVFITGLGVFYFCSAREFALILDQRAANARWKPRWLAPFRTTQTPLWLVLAAGVVIILLGVEFLAMGARFYFIVDKNEPCHHRARIRSIAFDWWARSALFKSEVQRPEPARSAG